MSSPIGKAIDWLDPTARNSNLAPVKANGDVRAEYVTRLRMEWAKALAGSDRPLATIALELGYYDQANFTRRFRSVVGCTPSVCRVQRRSPGS